MARTLTVLAALSLAVVVAAAEWTATKSWTGAGLKQTESFTTTTREWRLRWNVEPINPNVSLRRIAITVFSDQDKIVSTADSSEAQGESYVRGVGTYYLQISGVNVKWTVAVEEQH